MITKILDSTKEFLTKSLVYGNETSETFLIGMTEFDKYETFLTEFSSNTSNGWNISTATYSDLACTLNITLVSNNANTYKIFNFDNQSSSSFDITDFAAGKTCIEFILPENTIIQSFQLDVTGVSTDSPNTFEFQGSNDNINWITMFNQSSNVTWESDYIIKKFNITDYSIYNTYTNGVKYYRLKINTTRSATPTTVKLNKMYLVKFDSKNNFKVISDIIPADAIIKDSNAVNYNFNYNNTTTNKFIKELDIITHYKNRNYTTTSLSGNQLNQIIFSSDNRGFITGNNGILFRTDDNGNNWNLKISGLNDRNFGCIDYVNDDILLVSNTNTGSFYDINYLSNNGGESWSCPNTVVYASTGSVILSKNNLLLININIYRTIDKLANISTVQSGFSSPNTASNQLIKLNSKVLYAFNPTNFKIYKSNNNGINWTSSSALFNSSLLSFFPVNEQVMYAGGRSDSGWTRGLRKTTNGGASWSFVCSTHTGNITDDRNVPNAIYFISEQIGWFGTVGIGGVSGKIYETVNGGASWNVIYDAGANNSIQNLKFNNGYLHWVQTNGIYGRMKCFDIIGKIGYDYNLLNNTQISETVKLNF